MRAQRAAISFAVVLASILADESRGQDQPLTCETANFSESVRAKMPTVRKACLEITLHDGVPYATLHATVTRVRKDGVEVRFTMPDGSQGERRFIETRPDLDVLVGGEKVRVEDLAVGQELTTYLKVTEPVVALAQPPAEPPAPPVPLRETPPPAPAPARVAEAAMPRTAGTLPLFGLIGATLLTFAGVVRSVLRDQ